MVDRTRRAFIAGGALAAIGSFTGCLGSDTKMDGSSLPFTTLCRTDISYTVIGGKDLSTQTGFLDGTEIVRYSRSLTTEPPVPELSNVDLKDVSK